MRQLHVALLCLLLRARTLFGPRSTFRSAAAAITVSPVDDLLPPPHRRPPAALLRRPTLFPSPHLLSLSSASNRAVWPCRSRHHGAVCRISMRFLLPATTTEDPPRDLWIHDDGGASTPMQAVPEPRSGGSPARLRHLRRLTTSRHR